MNREEIVFWEFLPLTERRYVCKRCGMITDRDLKSALFNNPTFMKKYDKFIPEHLLTEYIQKYSNGINHIPDRYQTKEIIELHKMLWEV